MPDFPPHTPPTVGDGSPDRTLPWSGTPPRPSADAPAARGAPGGEPGAAARPRRPARAAAPRLPLRPPPQRHPPRPQTLQHSVAGPHRGGRGKRRERNKGKGRHVFVGSFFLGAL